MSVTATTVSVWRAALPPLMQPQRFSANSIPDLFRGCGKALMMASGGASGVVFGTLFQGAGKSVKSDVFDAEALVHALEGGLKAVQDRRKANVGDKTMVDALAPAAVAARKALVPGAPLEDVAEAAAKAAAAGVEATRGLVAKIGKSKGLGERTVGFVDPGALTTSILLEFDCRYATKPGPVVVALWL